MNTPLCTFTRELLCVHCPHFSWVSPYQWNTGLYGDCLFNIWGAARLISKVAAPFSISTSSVRGSSFSTSLSHLSWPLFDYSHPSGGEVASLVVLIELL